jgi:hypothetical protein
VKREVLLVLIDCGALEPCILGRSDPRLPCLLDGDRCARCHMDAALQVAADRDKIGIGILALFELLRPTCAIAIDIVGNPADFAARKVLLRTIAI